MKSANALTKQRKKSAGTLQQAVTKELNALGFGDGRFEVSLSPVDPGPHGCDMVDFGFAPNVGEPMRPLRQIASQR